MNERDELLSCYSDFYKDLNGFRPRGEWLRTATVEELRAAVNRVSADLEHELERERDEQADWVEWDLAREQAEADGGEDTGFPLSGEGWAYCPAS